MSVVRKRCSSPVGALVNIWVVLALACLINQANAQPSSDPPRVTLATSKGKIVVELAPEKAPVTVANFLQYTQDGFYVDTVFHRVIPGFLIQGGGMTSSMQEKSTRGSIVLEASNGLSNERGTIAMGRMASPNSATSQFFINLTDNPMLDPGANGPGYAVFGRVVSGMEVVDAIAAVPTGSKGVLQNVPLSPVALQSAQRTYESPATLASEEKSKSKGASGSAAVSAAATPSTKKSGIGATTSLRSANAMAQTDETLQQTADGFSFQITPQEGMALITATGGPCSATGIKGMTFTSGQGVLYLNGTFRSQYSFTADGRSRILGVRTQTIVNSLTDWNATVAENRKNVTGYTRPSQEKELAKESLEQAECMARSHMQYVNAMENWIQSNLPLLYKLQPSLKTISKSAHK